MYTFGMARDKGSGFRLDLGDELSAKLEDFRAAFYRADKTEIIREALVEHIERVLNTEPLRKEKYEAARLKRLSKSPPEDSK